MNPETLLAYDALVESSDGEHYSPHACGRLRSDGMWEAWLEFDSLEHDLVWRTPVETVQPDRASLLLWAEALTTLGVEAAFTRAELIERVAPVVAADAAAAATAEAAAEVAERAATVAKATARTSPRTARLARAQAEAAALEAERALAAVRGTR